MIAPALAFALIAQTPADPLDDVRRAVEGARALDEADAVAARAAGARLAAAQLEAQRCTAGCALVRAYAAALVKRTARETRRRAEVRAGRLRELYGGARRALVSSVLDLGAINDLLATERGIPGTLADCSAGLRELGERLAVAEAAARGEDVGR